MPGKLGAGRKQEDDGGREKDKEKMRMKRRVITLADVQKSWQEELDRRADARAGRFAAFDGADDGYVGAEVGDGEMEVDGRGGEDEGQEEEEGEEEEGRKALRLRVVERARLFRKYVPQRL